MEVNIETAEKLMVSRHDFLASLNNDIKPVSSRSEDILRQSIFVAFYLSFSF